MITELSTCIFVSSAAPKLSSILDINAQKLLVCAVILTRIDYCNSALACLSDSALAPMQRVLHAAARFVLDLQPLGHATVALQKLHCTALAIGASTYYINNLH